MKIEEREGCGAEWSGVELLSSESFEISQLMKSFEEKKEGSEGDKYRRENELKQNGEVLSF